MPKRKVIAFFEENRSEAGNPASNAIVIQQMLTEILHLIQQNGLASARQVQPRVYLETCMDQAELVFVEEIGTNGVVEQYQIANLEAL